MQRSSRENIRVVTFRLYPRTQSNFDYLNGAIKVNKYVWNSALRYSQQSTITVGLSAKEFLTDFKKEKHNQNLSNYNSRILEKEVLKLEMAFEQAFKMVRGFPKFKGKNSTESFYVDKQNSSISYRGKKGCKKKLYLKISGTQKIPSREFMLSGQSNYMDGEYLGCVIVKHVNGFYGFVQFDVEGKYIKKGAENGAIAAIDLNANNFTMLSSDGDFKVFKRPTKVDKKTGKEVDAMQSTYEEREKIQSERDKKVDQKIMKKGSLKFNEIKNKIKELHKKESDIRRTYVHTVSREIADSIQLLFVEDLNLKEMGKNEKGTVEEPKEGTQAKTNIIRKFIVRSGSGALLANLDYKMWMVIKVNPVNTSRTCPKCGHIHKDNRLSQEEFICVKCGFPNENNRVATHYVNADKVAAYNIYNRGMRILNDLVKMGSLDKERLSTIAKAFSNPRIQKEKEKDKDFEGRLREAIKKAAGKRLEELIKLGECNKPLDAFPKDEVQKVSNERS